MTIHRRTHPRGAFSKWIIAPLLMTLIFSPMAACSDPSKQSALPAGTSVLAFGDSVTYGTGAAPNEDFPTRLAARTGWKIDNAGIPGDTADAARERIGATIKASKPSLVIIEIGGNDFLRQRPEKAVKEDIRQMLIVVRQSGATPVLVAVPKFSMFSAVTTGLSDSDIYAELAAEEKVLLIRDVFADILSDNRLKTDPIHPNAAGYQKMADGIAAALIKAGLLAKP